ncbi:MAG TPA: nitroreductase family deazaflavin-dependent oxidoreductase [Herpetosiphonaceae bacterium]
MTTAGDQASTGRRVGQFESFMQRFITGLHVLLYRLSDGKIGGRLVNNSILLLSTVGRKSGKLRVTPLLYLPDGDRMVLIASNGGTPTDPGWYLNLQARPEVIVRVGERTLHVKAEDATGEERQRLWERAVRAYGGYADYQKRTDRQIPVVILRPVEAYTENKEQRAKNT